LRDTKVIAPLLAYPTHRVKDCLIQSECSTAQMWLHLRIEDKIAVSSRRSNRCSDRGDREKNTLRMHTILVPQATTNHLTPFLDCDPSIAALGCPKKMMLLERSTIKVLICFTDAIAVWARLGFKPWSSSQAALSSGSMNP